MPLGGNKFIMGAIYHARSSKTNLSTTTRQCTFEQHSTDRDEARSLFDGSVEGLGKSKKRRLSINRNTILIIVTLAAALGFACDD